MSPPGLRTVSLLCVTNLSCCYLYTRTWRLKKNLYLGTAAVPSSPLLNRLPLVEARVCFGRVERAPHQPEKSRENSRISASRSRELSERTPRLVSWVRQCLFQVKLAMSAIMNFKNCDSVLVTGANRGLGLQIVDSLASGGFSPGKIIATARQPSSAQVNTYTDGW